MIISFIGTERGDIPYYLLNACLKDKKKVLFLDNSLGGELAEAIIPQNARSRSKRKAVIVRNCYPKPEYMENFDVVIEFAGKRGYMEGSDYVYFVSNFFPHELKDNSKVLDKTGRELTGIILVDRYNNKISLLDARKRLGFPKSSEMSVHVTDYDGVEHLNLFNLLVNGKQTKKVSSQMGNLIKELTIETGLITEKKTKKPKKEEEEVWL